MNSLYRTIAFQGMPGAYSDLACRAALPDLATLPCNTFEEAFQAVREGRAGLAMIPMDNTLAGRVADVHQLMPEGDLYIIAEHFQPIRHCLIGLPGAALEDITDVHTHVHAIPQCRNFIREQGLSGHVCADTAKAAADVRLWNRKSQGAIASELAARIYGLEVLARDIQDADHNTTRFIILSRKRLIPEQKAGQRYLTSFVFDVRNIPAALYKALGGFATNAVQMVKLESYVDRHFNVARFYADVEGHIDDAPLTRAFDELRFFAGRILMLGTYQAHPFRHAADAPGPDLHLD